MHETVILGWKTMTGLSQSSFVVSCINLDLNFLQFWLVRFSKIPLLRLSLSLYSLEVINILDDLSIRMDYFVYIKFVHKCSELEMRLPVLWSILFYFEGARAKLFCLYWFLHFFCNKTQYILIILMVYIHVWMVINLFVSLCTLCMNLC